MILKLKEEARIKIDNLIEQVVEEIFNDSLDAFTFNESTTTARITWVVEQAIEIIQKEG